MSAREDLKECKLVFFTRTSPKKKMDCLMHCILRDGLTDYYETEIDFPLIARYLKYYFELKGKDGTKVWLCAWGISNTEPQDGFFEFLYANDKDCIRIPEWAKGQVFYQIFPDRFFNGNKNIDPPGCVKWGSVPDRENYMGGDLAGIEMKLPYLENLGIECIYLNPIFKAEYNHKYATEDYYEVDPAFGTKEDLKRLVRKCHKKGIRVILDGVFNHSGIKFEPFVDLLNNQEKSEYKDWFGVSKYPVVISKDCYECVGAYPWMPKLNTANPKVRQYILNVMKYWIEEVEIDGWRLDVADEVDSSVWTQARVELKETFPDCLLLGETWGSGQKLMQGNEMDSIMNYGVRDAIRDFLAEDKIDARGFDERINHVMAFYPKEMQDGLYNLLDSHDTERILTLCGHDMERMKLAVAVLMCLPGSPAVYYGDEVGMDGANDPYCRGAFPWDEQNQEKEIFEWYRELISLRKREVALRRGSFIANYCDNKIYGFIRYNEEEYIYLICNVGQGQTVKIPVIKNGKYEIVFPVISEINNNFKYIESDKINDASTNFYNGDITIYTGTIRLKMPEKSVLVIKKLIQVKEEEL
jgi:glycosidase